MRRAINPRSVCAEYICNNLFPFAQCSPHLHMSYSMSELGLKYNQSIWEKYWGYTLWKKTLEAYFPLVHLFMNLSRC